MPDLFDYAKKYPNVPGYQKTDTSKAAANDMRPKKALLHRIVLDALRDFGDMTTHEICSVTSKDYDAIQPRTSELREIGKISDSGIRRRTPKGKASIVWRLAV